MLTTVSWQLALLVTPPVTHLSCTHAQAMAMGLPVISTNWSGLTEFMSEAVAYPIHVEAMEESDDPGCVIGW
jgi:hypothetical protein